MKFWKIFLIIAIIGTLLSLLAAGALGVGLYMYLTPDEEDVSYGETAVLPGTEENADGSYASDEQMTLPDPEVAVMDEKEIIGEWIAVYRNGDTIYTSYYCFNEDGTYFAGGGEYLHTSRYPELFAEYQEGWQPAPMGSPYDHGTYTFSDGVIELTCYGSDVEEYQTPAVSWVEISEYNGDTAVWVSRTEYHEGTPRVYFKNLEYDYDDLEELFEKTGVDTAP